MKKGMFVCVMFVLAVIISGCGSPEEGEVEMPAARTEAVQEAAPAQEVADQVQDEAAPAGEGMADTAERAAEEAASDTEQAVGAVTEMGQGVMEDVGEKMTGEVRKAAGALEGKGRELMEKPEIAAGVEQAEQAAAKVEEVAGGGEDTH